MEKKNKFLGFRISYTDYMLTLQSAEQLGVTVSDFILSILLPKINPIDVKQSVQSDNKPGQVNDEPESNVRKEVSQKKLKSNEKELIELEEKIKKYTNKLKTI